MKRIEWRPSAERDAVEAALWYGRKGGVDLGKRFLSELERVIGTLGVFPRSGSLRHSDLIALPAPLRFLPLQGFNRYLVYYVDMPDRVDIVRVWDASRGLAALSDEA